MTEIETTRWELEELLAKSKLRTRVLERSVILFDAAVKTGEMVAIRGSGARLHYKPAGRSDREIANDIMANAVWLAEWSVK